MIRFRFLVVLVAGTAVCLASARALAQQTTVTSPLSNVGSSYYESIGSNWGVQGPGWFFRFGGAGTSPQFGNFDPNAGASGGYGFGGHGVNGYFNWWAGQGANRSNSSVAVTGNMISGTQAVISDTSQSPFVIGFVPVVGNYQQPGFVTPNIAPPAYAAGGQASTSIAGEYLRALRQTKAQEQRAEAVGLPNAAMAADPARPTADRPEPAEAAPPAGGAPDGLPSSAERPAMSVAEARAAHAAEAASEANEALVWMERARGAEEAGKANVAKIYYRMAAGRATGPLRQQALDRLAALREADE